MAYSEHICTASYEGVAFLQSHTVSTQRELRKERRQKKKKVIAPFCCFLFFDGWIIQVMCRDNESCILSVNMEDAPRVNHGQEAFKRLDLFSLSLSYSLFCSLLFLIGIEWNVRCLVNVVLNPFKQKGKRTSIKRPCYLLLDCL